MLANISEVLNNSGDLIEERILGSLLLKDIPWISISSWTGREGISNAISLTLETIIHPENLPPGRIWKRDVRLVQRHTIPGQKFATQLVSEAEMLVLQVFEELAGRFAPHLYEIDPRIGLTMSKDSFPASPLFDPQDSTQDPSFCFKVFKNITDWVSEHGGYRSLYPKQYPGTECVFCKKLVVLHHNPEEIVWGGGNVGWVHHDCAPWITIPPSLNLTEFR